MEMNGGGLMTRWSTLVETVMMTMYKSYTNTFGLYRFTIAAFNSNGIAQADSKYTILSLKLTTDGTDQLGSVLSNPSAEAVTRFFQLSLWEHAAQHKLCPPTAERLQDLASNTQPCHRNALAHASLCQFHWSVQYIPEGSNPTGR